MGSISTEELGQWDLAVEEIVSDSNGPAMEKIRVAVRLRPLNDDELLRNDPSEWDVVSKTTITFKNSLMDRSAPPLAYTFDRVFCCESSTRQVYEEAAKEVALSAVRGINASIFAYGQTSSGKTYTMTGMTEMAAADIYDYMKSHKDREFVLKFSAMEIYNESVRDLLSDDNTPLRLLDGPDRSTIVEKLTEEEINGWDHIMRLLSICEAQREVGETMLNKMSSRSHQIIRLTIESSDREFMDKESSGTLVASVHFVDLAGSERASQAMSAGARLKEGCHINRSLLTLGTVIRKLSKGNNGHVPYRDSKLTRILQQSLGGNARTAIICTMSPARSHIEQSRNTLLFAMCAKEVVTSAQVNIVMSDKALVKHLQRELARLENELRRTRVEPTTDELIRERDDRIQQMERDIREITRQRDQARAKLEELLNVGEDDKKLTDQPRCFQASFSDLRISSHGHDHSSDNFMPVTSPSLEAPVSDFPGLLSLERRQVFSLKRESVSLDNAQNNKIEQPSKEVRCELAVRKGREEHECVVVDRGQSSSMYQRRHWRRSFGGDLIVCSSGFSLPEEQQRRHWRSSFGGAPMESSSCSSLPEEEENRHWRSSFGGAPIVSSSCSSLPEEERKCHWRSSFGGATIVSSSCSSLPQEEQKCHLKSSFGGAPIVSSSCSSLPEEEQKRHGRSNFDGAPIVSSSYSSLPEDQKYHWRSSFGGAPIVSSSCSSLPEEEQSQSTPPESILGDSYRSSRPDDIRRRLFSLRFGVEGDVESPCATATSVAEVEFPSVEDTDSVQDAEEKLSSDSIRLVKDTEVDSMATPTSQPAQTVGRSLDGFERQRLEIIDLWHACNVSILHRTFFFLLCLATPGDPIYIELELRRLSFLRRALTGDHVTLVSPASIAKAVRRERGMLCRRMRRRLTAAEREAMYLQWGIPLEAKRRRLQLARQVWTAAGCVTHAADSAAVVSKIVGEPSNADKEMLVLSFSLRRGLNFL